jgi:hypothetical protein
MLLALFLFQHGAMMGMAAGQFSEQCAAVPRIADADHSSEVAASAYCDWKRTHGTHCSNNTALTGYPQEPRFSDCSWRTYVRFIHGAIGTAGIPEEGGDIYIFGVFRGRSIKTWREAFPDSRCVGFDSFEGLPSSDTHNAWDQGMFNAGDPRSQIIAQNGGPSKVQLVKGFFADTLVPALPQELQLKTALFVEIDSDLYASAYEALDYMFKMELIKPGTLIGYDDWWCHFCDNTNTTQHPFESGEGQAHKEITEKYHVHFSCVAGACKPPTDTPCRMDGGAVFLVEGVGQTCSQSTGFDMGPNDLETVKLHNPMCLWFRSINGCRETERIMMAGSM